MGGGGGVGGRGLWEGRSTRKMWALSLDEVTDYFDDGGYATLQPHTWLLTQGSLPLVAHLNGEAIFHESLPRPYPDTLHVRNLLPFPKWASQYVLWPKVSMSFLCAKNFS